MKTSKFRFVKPNPCRANEELTGLTATSAIWDLGRFIDANEKHIAVPWASIGSVAIFDHSMAGRAPSLPSVLRGHSGPVIDVTFNPFQPDLLFTASEDAKICGWRIPEEGLKENMTDPLITLEGHGKKVGILSWHPAAANVLASSSPDATVKLWDVTQGAPKASIATKDQVFSVNWNLDGTQLSIMTKDKKLALVDSRSGAVHTSVDAHVGSKAQRAVWAKRKNVIITAGFNRSQQRQMMVWDARSMEKPLQTLEIDQASSIPVPHVDEDTGMVYIAGRGESSIKLYDLWMQTEPLVFLNAHSVEGLRGVAFMPKSSLDVSACEVARVLKLTNKSLGRISFNVPRKLGAQEFQDDLFPPTFAATPAIQADDFFSGKNAEPNMMDMAGKFTGDACATTASANVVADSAAVKTPVKSAAASPGASPAKAASSGAADWDGKSVPTAKQVESQTAAVAELEKLLGEAKTRLEAMQVVVAKAEEEAASTKASAAAAKDAPEEKVDEKPSAAATPAEVEAVADSGDAAKHADPEEPKAKEDAPAAAAADDDEPKKEKKEKKDKAEKKAKSDKVATPSADKKEKKDKKDKKDKKKAVEEEEAAAEAEAEAAKKKAEEEEAARKKAEEEAAAKKAEEEAAAKKKAEEEAAAAKKAEEEAAAAKQAAEAENDSDSDASDSDSDSSSSSSTTGSASSGKSE